MRKYKNLSQAFGTIAKGYAYDSPLGRAPVHQIVLAPSASGVADVLASTVLADGAVTVVTSGISNPDVYRTVSITGNQGSITGDVVVLGKDWAGRSLSETITSDGTNTVNGLIPFVSIDKITLPARNNPSDELSVGITDLLGLQRPIDLAADVLRVISSGVVDANATADATEGTISLQDRAADGVIDVIIDYLSPQL